MKKTILSYGFICGAISATLLLILSSTMTMGDPTRGMVIGYASMVLAFSLIYFAIATHKKNSGGYITFGSGLKIGLGITVITCACYSLAWTIGLEYLFPDFVNQYANAIVERMRAAGDSQVKIDAALKEMEPMKDIYANKLYTFLFTMIEPLPVGVLVTLIASLILKGGKPRPVVPEAQ